MIAVDFFEMRDELTDALNLLRGLHYRFRNPAYEPDMRDRAEVELIKTTTDLADAIERIEARLDSRRRRWDH